MNHIFVYFSCLLVFLVLFTVCLIPVSFAENFTLYSSVSSSDIQVKNLIGIYQNSPEYDPYNEFEVARVGQYDYRIFFGHDLDAGVYTYLQYYGYQTGYGSISWGYAGGTGSNLYIDKNGYMTVGNVQNTIKSPDAETFKYQYVLSAVAILVAVVFLFKSFRQKIVAKPQRGWRI